MTPHVFKYLRGPAGFGLISLLLGGCVTPVSQGLEVHTSDLSCDDANRLVYAALRDMRMEVTSFEAAKPGKPGSLTARRDESNAKLAGSVSIRCEAGRVDIVADQANDFLGDKEFERGVFLGVTGRGDLEVVREGRYATGEVRRREDAPTAGPESAPAAASASSKRPEVAPRRPPRVADPVLTVRVEALRGFASVLDFDVDLSAVGVLPVKVSIRNGTQRAYDFDPRAMAVSVAGERSRVAPLTLDQAYQRLSSGGDSSEIGDVVTAKRIMAEKALSGGRIAAGEVREGFVYFSLADYERARFSMTDVATGESEGFVVDF